MRQYFEQSARIFKSSGIKLQLVSSAYRFQGKNFCSWSRTAYLVIIFSLSLIGYHVLFDKNLIG